MQYIKEIMNTFKSITIEDPVKVLLKESLGNTKYVVGLNTTVLSEAYIEGKEIVIDDISDYPHFIDAQKRNSIVFQRDHMLLSEIIKVS